MGISTKTVTIITCDLCGDGCESEDGAISIQAVPGDGRDVGPGYLTAVFRVDIPYRVVGGIICRNCKIKWLKIYLAQQEQPQ